MVNSQSHYAMTTTGSLEDHLNPSNRIIKIAFIAFVRFYVEQLVVQTKTIYLVITIRRGINGVDQNIQFE